MSLSALAGAGLRLLGGSGAAGWRSQQQPNSQSSPSPENRAAGKAGKGKMSFDGPPHQGPRGNPLLCPPLALLGCSTGDVSGAGTGGTEEPADKVLPHPIPQETEMKENSPDKINTRHSLFHTVS